MGCDAAAEAAARHVVTDTSATAVARHCFRCCSSRLSHASCCNLLVIQGCCVMVVAAVTVVVTERSSARGEWEGTCDSCAAEREREGERREVREAARVVACERDGGGGEEEEQRRRRDGVAAAAAALAMRCGASSTRCSSVGGWTRVPDKARVGHDVVCVGGRRRASRRVRSAAPIHRPH